jgi:hypothetical protein
MCYKFQIIYKENITKLIAHRFRALKITFFEPILLIRPKYFMKYFDNHTYEQQKFFYKPRENIE